MANYNGRVYDGPWEGRMYSSEWPHFRVALMPPISLTLSPDDVVADCVDIHHGYYHWSRALRAWVFEAPCG